LSPLYHHLLSYWPSSVKAGAEQEKSRRRAGGEQEKNTA